MSKPSCTEAPTWAKYSAMDADGHWVWYGSKPDWNAERGMWETRGWMQPRTIDASDTLERLYLESDS